MNRTRTRPLGGLFRQLGPFRKLHSAGNAFTFLDEDQLIRFYVFDGVDLATRPADFQYLNLFSLANAEVYSQIVLRDVTAAASNFIDLLVRLRFSRRVSHALE